MKTSTILVITTGILIVIIGRSCAENDYDTHIEEEPIESSELQVNACCQNNALVHTAYECNDTSPTHIPDCAGAKILLRTGSFHLQRVDQSTYLVGTIVDRSGKIVSIFLPTSKVCFSPMPREIRTLVTLETSAVVCFDFEVKYEYSIFLYVLMILNVCSMIACILTSFLYRTLPSLQDTHGEVAFHFSLTWSLFHASAVYRFLILFLDLTSADANICFVNLYLQIYISLVVFTWSLILSYDTWLQSRMSQNSNQRLRSIIYKCVGYGLPASIILIGTLHAHIKHLNDELMFAELCIAHGRVLSEIYVVVPACVTLIVNVGFIVSSQIELSRIRQEPSRRSIRGINYRIWMSLKLVILTGIPLLMGVIFLTFVKVFQLRISTVTAILGLILAVAVSCEGIIIFTIMVALRKRVLRAIGQSGLLTCHFATSKWKNMADSESEEENVVQEGIE